MPFGVSMIAVLTGPFIEAMADKWHLDEQDIPSVSKPLCNGRGSYANVSLRRIIPIANGLAANPVAELEEAATGKTDEDSTGADNTIADEAVADEANVDTAAANKGGDESRTDDKAKADDKTKTDADKTDVEKTE